MDRESIQDLVLSRSNVATLDRAGREAKLAEVLAFYDEYGRGMDGMQLPYEANCFRATVIDRPRTEAPEEAADQDPPGEGPPATDDEPEVSDGTDTDMLLIDFR